MKFMLDLLCKLVVSVAVVTGLQASCPDGSNCAPNFDVKCSGYSMADITTRVPSDTLYYTAKELNVDLGSVNFTHLTGLRNLTVNTFFDNIVFDRRLIFPTSKQLVFEPFSNLSSLNISISWDFTEPMPEMFSYLNKLEVLDLSYTRFINYSSLQQSFKGLKNNHGLSRIILKNTQTFPYLHNGLSFNLSHFLEPIAHCPLQHLDVSYNSLKSIHPGLIRFAPNLTEIIATNNFYNFFDRLNSAFFLEVILHPKLQVADFSR